MVAHIITFLSGHICLSTWAGVVGNSLMTASRREKQVLSLQLPQETKYPRSVMNDIKVCLATNWWQLWLHWRKWQISRVPEVVHWRRSYWLYGFWDNTLRTVLVAVHQRWGQEAIHYTVLEAPSCQMNRNWLYRYRNWRYRYHNWPYRHCNWPYRFRNWPYRHRNWPYRYSDYSTPFAVNRYLSESMQLPTHIECSSGFFPPKKPEPMHFLRAMRSSNNFPLFRLLSRGWLFIWSLFETSYSGSPQLWRFPSLKLTLKSHPWN